MERGTDREQAAVAERWAALERRRVRVTRVLRGLTLSLAGAVLLALAAAPSACTRDAGVPPHCVAVAPAPVAVGAGVVGAAALGYGLWQCARGLGTE